MRGKYPLLPFSLKVLQSDSESICQLMSHTKVLAAVMPWKRAQYKPCSGKKELWLVLSPLIVSRVMLSACKESCTKRIKVNVKLCKHEDIVNEKNCGEKKGSDKDKTKAQMNQ